MLETILNLIPDIKICLLLASLAGLLGGYFYTKAKSKEKFLPKIVELEDELQLKKSESNEYIAEYESTKGIIANNKSLAQKAQSDIHKYEKNVNDIKEKSAKLHMDIQSIKKDYQSKENLLNEYTQKVGSLKSNLHIDDVSKIKESKKNIVTNIKTISSDLDDKSKLFKKLTSKKETIEKESKNLVSKISDFKNTLRIKSDELKEASKKALNIEDTLEKEYEDMLKIKDENLAKIDESKNELLKIKEQLGLSS